ncbi:MAG: ABC transporter ATP-binding protein [Planctomycetes bacterium]|nr:ABC transporter ATP-binding protein [Planctomycetota bacterium]MBA3671992.1 ABC transporter ATP-binding protein [Gemmatimonadaceae bacterium]
MPDPAIVVDNLVKRFDTHTVLGGVSFTVEEGETVSVLGRSGTGKSVLLKTIIALLDPDEGSVRVLGQDLHRLDEEHRLEARKGIGYVFQGAALFDSLNVLENVGFALYQKHLPEDEIRKTVLDRLEAVGLEDAIDKFPSELSGGMQKRVGLARAIVESPRIILYDEPTTGLDPLTTDVINKIILRLRAKSHVTSIVVTHDIRSALAISDRLIMIDQGRIVANGTPSEIQASDNAWVQRFLGIRSVEAAALSSRPRIAIRRPPPAAPGT